MCLFCSIWIRSKDSVALFDLGDSRVFKVLAGLVLKNLHRSTSSCIKLEQRVPAGSKTFGFGEEHLDNNVPEVQRLAARAHMPSEDRTPSPE